MRKIIAALQTSGDCFIEGPNGELDWAMAEDEETWRAIRLFIFLVNPNSKLDLPICFASYNRQAALRS